MKIIDIHYASFSNNIIILLKTKCIKFLVKQKIYKVLLVHNQYLEFFFNIIVYPLCTHNYSMARLVFLMSL